MVSINTKCRVSKIMGNFGYHGNGLSSLVHKYELFKKYDLFEAIRKVSINKCTILRLISPFFKECCVGSGTLKTHKNTRQFL